MSPSPAILPATWRALLLEELLDIFWNDVDSGTVDSAQRADERAAELVGETELDPDSADYIELMAALCDAAGEAFPGEWEDYDHDDVSDDA